MDGDYIPTYSFTYGGNKQSIFRMLISMERRVFAVRESSTFTKKLHGDADVVI